MTLTLDNYNGMELMWQNLPKKPDANHVTLTLQDVDWMWHSGMVDTKKFSLDKWRSAFEPHKTEEGTFILTKEEMVGKETYRYTGEVMIPFDSMLINEGKYTDEALNELFRESIEPSCSYSAPEMKEFLDDIKKKFREKNGLVKMDKTVKIIIKDLIERNPSPLRRLELMFDSIIKGDSAIPEEKRVASAFSMRAKSSSEARFEALKSLEKKKKKSKAEEPAAKQKPSVSLSKVKRSRKGVRG